MEQELSYMLKEYGLDEKEISVYLSLVGRNELTAYKIAKETKIHRSTCYDILERLIQKGFINKLQKEETYFYAVNDISRIISNLKVKENLLLNITPKLQELEKKEDTKIKYFEGVEGQSQFNLKLFNLFKNREIGYCYILGNTYSTTTGSNLFIEKLINLLKNKKGVGEYKGIWNPKYRGDEIIKKYNLIGENKFLEIPSGVGTIIYENGVAFLYATNITYTIDIQNKKVAEEFKAYFEILWKQAKP